MILERPKNALMIPAWGKMREMRIVQVEAPVATKPTCAASVRARVRLPRRRMSNQGIEESTIPKTPPFQEVFIILYTIRISLQPAP